MTSPRSETLVVTATDRGGHASSLSIPLTWTAVWSLLFPGDPGPNQTLWGQTEDPIRGGVDYIPTRAVQYAADLGLPVGQKVWPKAHHGYIQPVSDSSAVAAATSELSDVDKVQAWGGYSLTDMKETVASNGKAHSLQDVANGSSDAMFDTMVAGLKARGKPAGAFFHNEPVGDVIGGVLATPADLAGAVDRLGQRIIRVGADNLITWGCFLGIGSFTTYGGSGGPPDPWIAALARVSPVLANNRYQQATDTSGTWKSPAQLYQPYWDLQNSILDGLGLPRMARFVGEYGTHTRSSDLTYAPAWMDAFYQLCLTYNVRVAFYFDSGQNSANDWTLDLNGETSRRRKMAQQLTYATSGYAHAA